MKHALLTIENVNSQTLNMKSIEPFKNVKPTYVFFKKAISVPITVEEMCRFEEIKSNREYNRNHFHLNEQNTILDEDLQELMNELIF